MWKALQEELSKDEALTTRSAGNLVRCEFNRKGALPRAVRESRDYGSAVRVRILALL